MSKHKIVVGLGFGDEGKGTIVDYLTASDSYDFVIRFSGGPQAAHNVVTSDDRHHTFAQFGSGSFNGVPTILTRHMLVNPFNMAKEAEALQEKLGFDPMNMITISENALLVTPWHVAVNQLEEIRRGDARHGSCGQGIGVTQKFALDYPDLALRVKDMLLDRDSFVAKATIVRALLAAEYGRPDKVAAHRMGGYIRMDFDRTPGNLQAMYSFFMKECMPIIVTDEEITELIADSNCVWEGSQGALLDEWRGFHPYTTWSTTTAHKALQMLSEAGVSRENVEVVGVTRTYHTRHGAGPFPSEDQKLLEEYPEPHNDTGVFQGAWRVGAWDLSLLKYGIDVNERIDSLAITHCDVEKKFSTYGVFPQFRLSNMCGDLKQQEKITNALLSIDNVWRHEHHDSLTLYKSVSDEMGVPISVLSYGPKAEDKLQIDNDFWSVVQ